MKMNGKKTGPGFLDVMSFSEQQLSAAAMEVLGPAALDDTEDECMLQHLLKLRFERPRPVIDFPYPWKLLRASVEEPGDTARHVKAKEYLNVRMKRYGMIVKLNSIENIVDVWTWDLRCTCYLPPMETVTPRQLRALYHSQ
jgi:hypothetical protein